MQRSKYLNVIQWPADCLHVRKRHCPEGGAQHQALAADAGPSDGQASGSCACISFRISGSGAQPIGEGLLKALLWTLSLPLFALKEVKSSPPFDLIPATRNGELDLETELLTQVYIESSARMPNPIPARDVGIKFTNKGEHFPIYDL